MPWLCCADERRENGCTRRIRHGSLLWKIYYNNNVSLLQFIFMTFKQILWLSYKHDMQTMSFWNIKWRKKLRYLNVSIFIWLKSWVLFFIDALKFINLCHFHMLQFFYYFYLCVKFTPNFTSNLAISHSLPRHPKRADV